MNSILYFGSDTVKFLRGSAGKNRVTIQDAATVRLDEGILLNGVITDERRLCEALNGLQPRIGKHVDIVVESSEIHTKAVEIPFLRPAAIRQTVRREFGRDADRDEEPIYDYAVLENRVGNENRGRILCCAMSRALLEGYRALFSAMGVTLSSCDVGLHALIRAVSLFPSFDRSAYVLTTVERNRMSCALFEGNRYLFSNSARLEEIPNRRNMPPGWRRGCRPSSSFINPKRRRQARPCLSVWPRRRGGLPMPRSGVFPGRPGRSSTGLSPDRPERPGGRRDVPGRGRRPDRKVKHGRPIPDGPGRMPRRQRRMFSRHPAVIPERTGNAR